MSDAEILKLVWDWYCEEYRPLSWDEDVSYSARAKRSAEIARLHGAMIAALEQGFGRND